MNTRIREVRKSLGLTMEKFGGRIGVAKSTISNIESGKREATNHMILSICREFDVNEKWLRTGEGNMFIEKLSTKEDIEPYLNEIPGVSDEFKKRFASILANLPIEGWEMIEQFAKYLVENKK